jgi:hypothetical protein
VLTVFTRHILKYFHIIYHILLLVVVVVVVVVVIIIIIIIIIIFVIGTYNRKMMRNAYKILVGKSEAWKEEPTRKIWT